MGILFCGLNPPLAELEPTPVGKFMITFNYGSWFTGALFIREAKSIFPAGFKESIRWLGEYGFHDVDVSQIYSRADIYAAQLELANKWREMLMFMLAQYFWYMVGAYFVFKYVALKEQGMIGWDPIVYEIKSNVTEPIGNYIKFGKFSAEITRREKDEITERRAQRKKTMAEGRRRKKTKGGEAAADVV
jgi:hypothetical protein